MVAPHAQSEVRTVSRWHTRWRFLLERTDVFKDLSCFSRVIRRAVLKAVRSRDCCRCGLARARQPLEICPHLKLSEDQKKGDRAGLMGCVAARSKIKVRRALLYYRSRRSSGWNTDPSARKTPRPAKLVLINPRRSSWAEHSGPVRFCKEFFNESGLENSTSSYQLITNAVSLPPLPPGSFHVFQFALRIFRA